MPAAEIVTREAKVEETEPGVWVVSSAGDKDSDERTPTNNSEGENSDASTTDSPALQTKAFGAANPSVANILLGQVSDGPRTEFFVVNFQAHMEPPLRDMALAMGEKWLAAGGHTGTTANPTEITVPSLMIAESANDVFKKVFTKGFAIQLISAIVGPPSPKILFKFRHVGAFTGEYTDEDDRTWQGVGQMLDVEGVCHVARNPSSGELGKVEVYYDHLRIIKTITDATTFPPLGGCPISGKDGETCPAMTN